jgi:hypothetical protein
MTAKSSRSTSRDESSSALTPLNLIADLPRRQLALATQSASALFRASEAIRKVQQQAAQRATAQHEEVAQRLRGPCDFNDLLAIQSELLRFSMQESAQYWQKIGAAALKAQVDLVSSANGLLDNDAEPTLDTLQKVFEASLNGTAASTPAPH